MRRSIGRRILCIIGSGNYGGARFSFQMFFVIFEFAQKGIEGVIALTVADYVCNSIELWSQTVEGIENEIFGVNWFAQGVERICQGLQIVEVLDNCLRALFCGLNFSFKVENVGSGFVGEDSFKR